MTFPPAASPNSSPNPSPTSAPLDRVKICGITDSAQGCAIAKAGATALGFICVAASPRFVTPDRIAEIVAAVRAIETDLDRRVDYIGVFANASLDTIVSTATVGGLTGIQLHGNEPPDFCRAVRSALPAREILKALRIRDRDDLAPAAIEPYRNAIDALLLDAYHPDRLGGTGLALDWKTLESFAPGLPWFLAGGLTPDNVGEALDRLHPTGIDLSSGVERAPGDKDLAQVERLFRALRLAGRSANAAIGR